MPKFTLNPEENDQLNNFLTPDKDATAREMPFTPTPSPEAPPAQDQTVDDQKIQDSHPGHQPEDLLDKDIQGKIAQSQKYGPEQEKMVVDNLMKSYNSLPNSAVRGVGGFADSIMQGVSRAGPSNFEKNISDVQNKTLDTQANLIPTLQGMNEKNMAAKQALEEKTSGSSLGSAESQAYQKVFKQVFPNMSQSELNALTKNPSIAAKIFPEMAPIIDKQVQNELKKMQIEATTSHQTAEEKNQAQQRLIDQQKMQVEHQILNFFGKLPFQNQQSTSSNSTPQPGAVYKGHTFLGGNPADKNSWKKN